tara:strand:- start:891 stop:1133 length:243 start_codon:yes stop_codon:yes gene_type:complete
VVTKKEMEQFTKEQVQKMITFNILSLNTGRNCGTVKGIDYDEAQNKCLAKGINTYDTYMLEPKGAKQYSSPLYIEDILEY